MARIRGTVTGPNGVALAGVAVTVTPAGGGAATQLVTDAQGVYDTGVIQAGNYSVTLQAPQGLQNPAPAQVNAPAGNQPFQQDFALVVVPPANGSITGRITDAAGAAVQGVQVTATLVGGAALPAVQSDNLGNYVIPAVPPGQYNVAMVPPAAFQAPANQQANVAAGPPTVVNAQLQPAVVAPPVNGSITGLVTAPDAAGANVGFPNVVVTATPAAPGPLPAAGAPPLADAGAPLPSVRTNQLGQYTIPNVPAGNYNVRVQSPGHNQNPGPIGVAVAAAPVALNIPIPADAVASFLNNFIGPNFEIETPVSMLEAGYAASFFRLANVILAGLTENGTGPDLFGSQRVATAANDLGIQETQDVWQQALRDAEALKNLVRDLIGAQSLVRLKREAKRQFNLGLENSVTANTRFPVLFRRLVDIATDPILTMDIANQDRTNLNLDKTKIGQADALLRELKDIVVQIVRSLSKEGQAQTRLDTESWVPVANVAMGMALRLAPARNTGDADDRNPWAVVSVLTNKRRDTEVTPFIVLGRHGGRLLELAMTIYQEMTRRNALTSFDTDVLRELFQDSRVRNTAPRMFFTDQLREQAAYIKAYPVPNWG